MAGGGGAEARQRRLIHQMMPNTTAKLAAAVTTYGTARRTTAPMPLTASRSIGSTPSPGLTDTEDSDSAVGADRAPVAEVAAGPGVVASGSPAASPARSWTVRVP